MSDLRKMAGSGDATRSWLQAGNATVVCGNPYRSSTIAAHAAWRTVRRNCSSLAAAGSSRRARLVRRMIGSACQEVVCFVVVQKLWCVRLSEDDGARGTKACNGRGVLIRNVPEPKPAAAQGGPSRNVEAVFDCYRNPV